MFSKSYPVFATAVGSGKFSCLVLMSFDSKCFNLEFANLLGSAPNNLILSVLYDIDLNKNIQE